MALYGARRGRVYDTNAFYRQPAPDVNKSFINAWDAETYFVVSDGAEVNYYSFYTLFF